MTDKYDHNIGINDTGDLTFFGSTLNEWNILLDEKENPSEEVPDNISTEEEFRRWVQEHADK